METRKLHNKNHQNLMEFPGESLAVFFWSTQGDSHQSIESGARKYRGGGLEGRPGRADFSYKPCFGCFIVDSAFQNWWFIQG